MKKAFSLSLILLLIVGMLSACSGSKNANGDGDKAIKLTVWAPEYSEQTMKVYKEIIAAFNEENKGKIEAKIEFIPRANKYAYEDKISTAASSNSLPDLLMMDGPNVSNYADAGIIQPIDDVVDDKSAFVDSVITQGTFDGKLYTLAPTESTVALFYNKKMLEEAGIHPPTKLEDAWTWNEFYEAAKKLTNKEKGIYGVNWTLDYGEWIIYFSGPFVWSNGGDFISADTKKAKINEPEAVEALTFLQKFTKEGLVNLQPTPDEFETGKAAMMLMGSWEWNKLKDYPETEWGITYYPRSPKGKVVSPSGDWCFGISASTKHKKEAGKLLNFILNKENVLKVAKSENKPAARHDSFEEMKEWNEFPLSVLKDQVLHTAHPRPRTTSYPILSQKYGEAVQNIFLGADVKEQLDKVAKAYEEDIARKK
ncbi:UNVERIFIED_ORG: carbohydrate ABC transporter substrate-binding protein (CUT1 family) [Anoxybacillus amylolyticus]